MSKLINLVNRIDMECIPIYGLIPEVNNYIDSKRNRCPLTHMEREWMDEHRQMWQHERTLAATQGRPPIRFVLLQKEWNIFQNKRFLLEDQNQTQILLIYEKIIQIYSDERR
jgi:hypothetical protein